MKGYRRGGRNAPLPVRQEMNRRSDAGRGKGVDSLRLPEAINI